MYTLVIMVIMVIMVIIISKYFISTSHHPTDQPSLAHLQTELGLPPRIARSQLGGTSVVLENLENMIMMLKGLRKKIDHNVKRSNHYVKIMIHDLLTMVRLIGIPVFLTVTSIVR